MSRARAAALVALTLLSPASWAQDSVPGGPVTTSPSSEGAADPADPGPRRRPGRRPVGAPGPDTEAEARRVPRLPLLRTPGAWDWVGGIFRRIMKAAGMKPVVPDAATRACLLGVGPCPPDPLPKDKDAATLLLIMHPSVNAFVTDARRVYVTAPLLKEVRSDDELAGVLAHEVGHLQGGHIRQVARKQLLYTLLGTLGGAIAGGSGGALAGQALGRTAALKYNRRAEHDADDRGYEIMRAAGYHPAGMLDFLGRLMEEDPSGGGPLSVFVSTHPPHRDRIRRLGTRVQEHGGLGAPRGLTYDFSREVLGPRPGTTARAVARSYGTTDPQVVLSAQAEDEPPEPEEEDPWVARLNRWRGVPEDFELLAGKARRSFTGLMLETGSLLRGPAIPLDHGTSYLLAGRVSARGEAVRAFLGLELMDPDGQVLTQVFPGSPGLFVDPGQVVRVRGVSHPFTREAASRGRVPALGRLVVRVGEAGAGRLVLQEVGLTPVGASHDGAPSGGRGSSGSGPGSSSGSGSESGSRSSAARAPGRSAPRPRARVKSDANR